MKWSCQNCSASYETDRIRYPVRCSCGQIDHGTHREVQRSRGLGDTVARVTAMLGFRPCKSCDERRAWLNDLVPYR